MKVRPVLAEKGSEVHRVGPDASVVSAAHDLKRFGVGALVVCGAAGRIHGILTERDVVYAVAASAGDVRGVKVADAMTRRVVTCDPDDDVADPIPRLGRAGPIPMGWSRPSRDLVGWARPKRPSPSLV